MAQPLSNDAFRAVVESAPDAILLVDSRGVIVYINPQTEALFGYQAHELEGERIEVLVPERLREMHVVHREVFGEADHPRPMGAGLRLSGLRKDGALVPVEISLSPFQPDGELLTLAIVRDVSEQRRQEEVVRRSEERLRLLTESALDIIFRLQIEPERRFEFVSAAVTRLTGHRPEEFYAHPEVAETLIHADDLHLFEEALIEGGPDTFTLRLIRSNGELRWFEFRVNRGRDARGYLACEGIARDVTERLAAEDEHQQLLTEIETQLERERIAGDLHDDIIQSAYSLGLSLHAQLDDPEVTKEAVLLSAIHGLNTVIGELRTYMQELNGQYAGLPARNSLRSRLQPLLGSAEKPTWHVEIEEHLDLDDGTERHLFLLAKELLSNISRHAEAEHASIRLRSMASGWTLEVSDDGVGFDPASVPATSYGLRSIDHRVSMLRASLELDTAPGKGTRVLVSIPRHAELDEVPPEPVPRTA